MGEGGNAKQTKLKNITASSISV